MRGARSLTHHAYDTTVAEKQGRKRETGRGGGLGSSSPWRDVVGEFMETHMQTLVDRHTRARPTWPARLQCHK